MKKGIIALILLLVMVPFSFSDTLEIPFDCWPLDIQREFLAVGKKIDIKQEDRTIDSWGYLVNEGSSYKIFTYKAISQEDFQVIQDIVFKIFKDKVNNE